MSSRISRVGELRKALESYSDNDFIYLQCGRYGDVLCAASEIVNGSSSSTTYNIVAVPMTNQTPQEYIKDIEEYDAQ